jgi:hypothetical protein
LETCWKLVGNLLETCWKFGKTTSGITEQAAAEPNLLENCSVIPEVVFPNFQQVSNKFPTSFQQVSNKFPTS